MEYLQLLPILTERQIDGYLISLRIISNPHMEQEHAREFVQELVNMKTGFRGPEEKPFDRAKFEALRKTINGKRKPPESDKI